MKKAGLAWIALLLAAAPLRAQFARGTVTEQGSGAALNGAFVVLLDSLGRQRNAALTDARGAFLMRAPDAGRFRVRAELIGHGSVTSPLFVIPPNATAAVNVELPVAAIEIAAVEVGGSRRCVVRPESGEQTARLWEEARKALAVAHWAKQEGVAEFTTRTYERELAIGSLAMVWQGVRTGYSQTRPYAAVSPDSLAIYGFVRTVTADSVLYYGPDAEVLVSDVFLDTHCFETRRGEADAAGLVGLAFTPVRGRKRPDISGTLWLDPKSSELRYIEFTYTGIDSGLNVKGVGGRTDFRRLPNGAWIVDRWYIRLPIPKRGPGGHLFASGLLEGGGEIVDAKFGGQAAPKASIRGIVFDSTRMQRLANAYVYLSGTAFSAVTDSTGRFEIREVASGHYTLAFSHPAFDSLPALPQSRRVMLAAPQDLDAELAVPTISTLVRRACPESNGGVVFGHVIAEDKVIVRFMETRRMVERVTVGDRTGRYMVCGVPPNAEMSVEFPEQQKHSARMPRSGYLRIDQDTR
jgi:hypothetical protein